jgi:DNA-binding GntR family transcriptional regulator
VLQSVDIGTHIIDAVLAGRLKAGTRLGEQQLAQLFAVSRTVVREALIRLETRGIVQVGNRRGWFIIEPSIEEAREAFHARRTIEIGLLHSADEIKADAITRLKEHVAREQDAIETGDVAARSYLLGDFHVCMAEVLGNRMLADILRDLTARTVLISMLYQSTHDATESCAEHAEIVSAVKAGDRARAASLMAEHIGHVEAGLTVRIAPEPDPLQGLRDALQGDKPRALRQGAGVNPAAVRRR